MNAQEILDIIAFIEKYGPTLVAVGGEAASAVKSLIAFIETFRGHESLNSDQQADLERILTTDPATWGNVPAPAPAPEPTPTPDPPPLPTPQPAPAPADPTAARYASVTDAIAALAGQYVLVLQYPDGQFGVWPNIGVLPAAAKQVYPQVNP